MKLPNIMKKEPKKTNDKIMKQTSFATTSGSHKELELEHAYNLLVSKYLHEKSRLMLTFCLAMVLSSSLFAVENLIVSGTNSLADGTYLPYTTITDGTPSKTYNVWRLVNGTNTYYIFHDNDNYWDIGTDYTNYLYPTYLFYYIIPSDAETPAGLSPWNDGSDNSVPGLTIISTSPEIGVFGNSTEITDGNTSPSFTCYSKFGSVDISSGSVTRTFTIKNSGLATLSITNILITGTNATDFTITSAPVSSVAALSEIAFSVKFDPSAIGNRKATITIANDDADEGTYDFSIEGYGYTPSNLVVSGLTIPSAMNGVYEHQGVLNGEYEYWKSSSASYYIYRSIYDFQPGWWFIDSDTDPSTFLYRQYYSTEPATAKDVNTWANPSSQLSSINITDYVAAPEINLYGNSTAIANNDATPRTADYTHFGTAEVGSGSITRTFTIQNAGGTNLQLTGSSPYITLSGANASDFTVTTLPATPITAGNSTTFQITFTPLGEGARTATVSIANNDGDENPFTFSIQGGGVYAKGLTVSGVTDYTPNVNGDYTYQGITDGFATWVHTNGIYWIYNSLYELLDSRDWRIDTDTDPDNGVCFSSPSFNSNPSPVGITPNSWAIGTISGHTFIGNPVIVYFGSEINVQGNGNSIASGDVTPITTDYTDFGSVSVSTGSVSHSFTIQNTGKGSLYLTGSPKVTISGTNASDFTVTMQPTSLLAATTGTTTFTVLFDPSAIGVRTATISIANDDSDENPYSFSVQGTGYDVPTATTAAVSSITFTGATLNGSVNANNASTTVTFDYGTTTSYGTTVAATPSLVTGTTATAVSYTISGLALNTTYHYRVNGLNTAGTSNGLDATFTTSPYAPSVETNAATDITTTTATLKGTCNPNNLASTGWFRYATTNPGTIDNTFGNRAPASGGLSIGSGALAVSYSMQITGLTPGTTYYYGAISGSLAGNGYGTVYTFTTQAIPTITWSNPADITYGTLLSATQLNATASVPGTFTYTPALGEKLNAGAIQTLTVNFTPTDLIHYLATSKTVTINVNKANSTITWVNPTAITYGTKLSATQLNATADVGGTFAYNPVLGTTLNAGTAQNLKVDFSPTDATNYTTATKTVTIDVAKATPVITWSNPAGITYGTTLSETQLNATADVAGTFTYTPTLGTLLHAGNAQNLKVDFTPTDATNYNTATKTVTIDVVVGKVTPVITWANPAGITYGTTLSATQLNATADVPGTYTYTPAIGTKLNAGTAQNLKVDFTPTDITNYNTTTKTVTIDVAKATPVITWANPAGITYGTILSATQLNATADVAGTYTYTPALGTTLNAGLAQNLKVDFTPTDATNYTTATKTVTIDVVVGKVTPVITWANPTGITYGTTLSATQLNATADVAGTFTYTPAFGTTLNAGNAQNLKVDFTPTDATNYTTATKTVTIDVAKATPVITWANPADITNETALSNTQLNASADVRGTFTYTPAIGVKLSVGNAQVLKADFTPSDQINYESASKTVLINVFLATGITEFENNESIVLYPNPVLEEFNVLGIDGKATISLTDLNGKVVLTKIISANEKVFVSDLSRGIYLIRITTSEGTVLKKMVKE